jgi:hypothetical protein
MLNFQKFLILIPLVVGCHQNNNHNKYVSIDQKVSNSVNFSDEVDNDCPLAGDAKTARLQELNILKNRYSFPDEKNYNPKVSLTTLLAHGDDTERWNVHSAAIITGYVRDVKPGGVETVNCKAKDITLRDTHIELVLHPNSMEKNEAVIVEITPRLRKIMASRGEDWSTGMIRSKYLGRWITVEGWLLFDFEHTNMSENTHPDDPKNWRGTAWEIHPVTNIEIAEKH